MTCREINRSIIGNEVPTPHFALSAKRATIWFRQHGDSRFAIQILIDAHLSTYAVMQIIAQLEVILNADATHIETES